ncbi:hypothetical protein MMC32_004238 [Xylographa parallela]|nr:hypothetical protein [Xylographa parallela]
MVLLVEMPYSGPNNNTKVQIVSSGTSVNETLVENVWKNGQVNATLTGTDAKGQSYKLFLNSTIDNGDQVTATFSLTPVSDKDTAKGTA